MINSIVPVGLVACLCVRTLTSSVDPGLDNALAYAERGQADSETLNDIRSQRRLAIIAGIEEMKPVSFTITLPQEIGQRMEAEREELRGLSLPDLIGRLSSMYVVRRLEARAGVEWAARNTPLTATEPTTVISGPGSTVSSNDDEAKLARYGCQLLATGDAFLVHFWEDLRIRPDVGPGDVTTHLLRNGALSQGQHPLIARGLERAWESDYASALHILVPQLEEALRQVLILAGHDPMHFRSNDPSVSEEITLAPVLDGLVGAGVMNEDECWMFHLILDEPGGRNARNRIAHGLVELEEMTAELFARVLQLFFITAVCAQRAMRASIAAGG